MAWRGAQLMPTYIFVCPPCYDIPNENVRAITLPADPVPIKFPLVEPFFYDETNNQTISSIPQIDPLTGIPVPGTTTLSTESGLDLTTQPIGTPVGLEQPGVMPQFQSEHYAVNLQPLSVTANGTDQVSVTCAVAHGMTTNDQMSVEGLSNTAANGFYSVTVTTATAFTYQTNKAIAAGGLLTATTNMITALVGLPLGYSQIPQTGV